MSTNNIVSNTGQQAFINTDTSKIFIWNNRYHTDSYVNNSTYDPITLLAGTVMGRIASTGILIPSKSDASDGSQFPYGILADDMIIAGGDTVKAPICISGDVVENKVVFTKIGDGLDTTVSSRRYRDRIMSDSAGIILVASTEMTDYDNV